MDSLFKCMHSGSKIYVDVNKGFDVVITSSLSFDLAIIIIKFHW